jgi:hypothetical protein
MKDIVMQDVIVPNRNIRMREVGMQVAMRPVCMADQVGNGPPQQFGNFLLRADDAGARAIDRLEIHIIMICVRVSRVRMVGVRHVRNLLRIGGRCY